MSHLVEYVSGILEDNGVKGFRVKYDDGKFNIELLIDYSLGSPLLSNGMRKLNVQTILRKYFKESQFVVTTLKINIPEPKLDPNLTKEINYERH
jgi:hypothetical protein